MLFLACRIAVTTATMLLQDILVTAAHAQTPGRAERPDSRTGNDTVGIEIRVPTVILAEPASDVALTIDLGPADRIPKNALVRLRGLPASATLSEGHAIAPGSWAVPTSALPRLRVAVPAGIAGKTDVTVMLVTIDGTMLAVARTALVVGSAARLIAPDAAASVSSTATPTPPQLAPPPPMPPVAATPPSAPATQPSTIPATPTPIPPPAPPPARAATAVAPPPPSPPRPPEAAPSLPDAGARAIPILTPDARARAQAQLQRGETLRRDGDVASARLFFERAAEAGLPEAALALGSTFDPHELAQLKVHGLKPDPAMARRWYERARELGHTDAATRLTRLGP